MSISNNDLFTLLQQDKINIDSIENPTDEMLWWAINNDKPIRKVKLSKDMILHLLGNGKSTFNIKQLNDIEVPENTWVSYINKLKFFVADPIMKYILSSIEMTENIAMALCLRFPIFYTDENIKKNVPENRKREISDVFFNGLKNETRWHSELPTELPISDEQWSWMLETNYLVLCTGRIENYIQKRHDVPKSVKYEILKFNHYLKEFGPITADELIVWLDAHKDRMDTWQCQDSIKYYLKCDDMESVLKTHGWFIKYLKNQSYKLCKASLDCDPSNIQYIKKPSEKVINYALSLDESVREYIKIENQYPANKYLIKFHENLCDEGYLIKVCVIDGKDMADFMDRTTSLSFGNLEDNEERNVKSIASYVPITDDELKVLRKFGLDNIQSGYFSDLD